MSKKRIITNLKTNSETNLEDSGKGSSIDKVKKIKIKVIGIGGGAGMIVSEIASEIKQSCFVAANTDAQALKTISKKVSCFQFGQAITNGLGTGMNPEKGREAAQNEKERIKKLCLGQDICIIVACLGGGVGSGAAPVFAKISKNLGNLTYGIFTLPFKFEGEKKMEISRDALSNAKKHLNAMTIIPNERVFQVIDKETSLKQSFSFINKNLAESLKGLIEIIYNPGLINIDFADIQTIFEGQGRLVYLNTVESSKTQTDKDLIARLLSSPLYSYKIKGAKGVLFNIAGEKNLYLADVNQISKAISELVNPEAKIIFGISQKRKPSKGIKVFLLAIGCLEKFISKSVSKSVSKSLQDLENREDGHQKKKKRKREKINFPNLVRFGTIKQKKKTAFPNSFPNPKGIWNTPKGIRKTKVSKSAMDLEDSVSKPLRGLEDSVSKPLRGLEDSQRDLETNVDLGTKIEIKPNESLKVSKPEEVWKTKNRKEKLRKSGLQIKKEAQDIEGEMLEKEKFWETPAFLRRKKI